MGRGADPALARRSLDSRILKLLDDEAAVKRRFPKTYNTGSVGGCSLCQNFVPFRLHARCNAIAQGLYLPGNTIDANFQQEFDCGQETVAADGI